jgi:hypothetical protein
MKLTHALSTRLLLLLVGTVPTLLLSSQVGIAAPLNTNLEEKPLISTPAVNFSPNLERKLENFLPLGKISEGLGSMPNTGVFVEENGPSWVEYIPPKKPLNQVVQPSAVDTFRSLESNQTNF